MSIKLFVYKIPKDNFENFFKDIRSYMLNDAFITKIANEINTYEKLEKIRELLFKNKYETEEKELQLFEYKNSYIIRVLERSHDLYEYINKIKKKYNIKSIIYCNSTDIPKTDEKNKKFADLLDVKIKNLEYFIRPVFTEFDFLNCIRKLEKK